MRPQRSKSFLHGLILIIICFDSIFLTPIRSAAQSCSGTLQSITYDTVVTSNTGNTGFTYKVPQFPVSTFTLYAVTMRSVVTVSLGVTIQNNSGATANAKVQVFRNDDITSPALPGSGDFNNTVFLGSAYSDPSMANGAIQSFGPSNVITNNSIIVDSLATGLGDLTQANWVGSGKVAFAYTPESALNTSPSNIRINSSAISDKISFSVTYYFCNPGTLATDFLTFTATRQNNQSIALNWIVANETPGRTYDVQLSKDGKTFTNISSQPSDPVNSDASYSYIYTIAPADKGKLYFRIIQENPNASPGYSEIRIIDLDAGGAPAVFSIYPNPPGDFINLTFPGDNQNWQVEIFAADGRLVQQNYYPSTSLVHLNFARKMASGAYFVRAVNPQTNQNYTGSFVIRN
jgi:hypothetical protein